MKISIIGAAGCIGSCTAFNLATHGLADELVMIGGSHQDALRQHALDITTNYRHVNTGYRCPGWQL